MLLREHIYFPPCSANHDTWHHKSIHESRELSTKSEHNPQCKQDDRLSKECCKLMAKKCS